MWDADKKIDLLSLTPDERVQVIGEIREALRQRVAERKIHDFWAFSKGIMIDLPESVKRALGQQR